MIIHGKKQSKLPNKHVVKPLYQALRGKTGFHINLSKRPIERTEIINIEDI